MSVSGTQEVSQTDRPTPLLTVPEVAAILRVTDRTVRRWANEGRIERIKLGGVARFTASSIEELIAQESLINE
jgi:excisionase family DNA binding protein